MRCALVGHFLALGVDMWYDQRFQTGAESGVPKRGGVLIVVREVLSQYTPA